ncbi:hypothetical protein [Roseobacter ponti]|uniref:Uncharacterized protein n=1 Tax=Roseobacter ponti TaxID=1891787 RepID=A0A858T0M8_9RHOB|nr:hypothetical protein [Roseobacter ponti]QJF53311.1 hypothetical protein G3256_18665 [Roseobacter ponti]
MTKPEHFDQSDSAIRQSARTERKSREACHASLSSVEASRRLLDRLRAFGVRHEAVSE